MGISLACTGDIAQGRAHFDRAMSLYDPVEHRPLATRFSVDSRVSVLSYRSWALWFLGYPDAALADAEQAISDAREMGQAATLMYALGHAPLTYSNAEITRKQRRSSMKLSALADEKGALFWMADGMMIQGCDFALTGKACGRCSHDHLRPRRMAVNGSNSVDAVVLVIYGESLCGARPIR